MTPDLDPANSHSIANLNNPALKDFNKNNKTEPPAKKNKEGKRKSSQKFPMPRNYKPNEYPDRNLTPVELTREMIQYYDFKKKPESYNKFIESTLREAPTKMSPLLFGHCPNCDCTPPRTQTGTLGHFIFGPI